MYHGTKVGNMVAVSSDPLLLNWEKVTGEAVIPYPDDLENAPYSVFDPCIWKKGGAYYALSGGTLPHGPGGRDLRANFPFRSEDLASWEYLYPFVEDDRYTMVGDDGACPYFWPIGDCHMLLFFSHTSGGQYLLGDYDTDRDKFVVTAHGKFNFGASLPSGVHVPSAVPDGEGGIVVIFNMNPGLPTEGWNQIMTLPRRLTLAEGDGSDDLNVEPAGDVESLRYDHRSIGPTTLPANEEVVLEEIHGNAMELDLEIDPNDAPVIELNVLRSPGGEETTRIAFFKERGFHFRDRRLPNPTAFDTNSPQQRNRRVRRESLITIDASRASTPAGRAAPGPGDGPCAPRGGRAAAASGVHRPERGGGVREREAVRRGQGLPRPQGRSAELRALDAWQMRTIYQA